MQLSQCQTELAKQAAPSLEASHGQPSRADIEAAVRTLIRAAGDDPDREGLVDTPARVARAYHEWFSGYAVDPAMLLNQTFTEAEPSQVPVDLVFNAAGDHDVWAPGAGSVLEFAESSGLTPEFGCRVGACGACKTPLIAGTVAYFRETSAAPGDDDVLICSAVPATTADGSINKLVLAIG